ncbi:Argininosuccinate lyase [Poriferisphaera corsica]|uniref:Argininosuccinate lyase n=1 Tax=Poriferisphaera corsica TaxID=2528020 RepID=A0A517YXY5_9BACT|nr:argininosuccinate lyase [Poriferisphaera corsica]QDU35085.1 Argininosuccinate lyase [Poriferisphaera corsica]
MSNESSKSSPVIKPWEHAKAGEGSAADPLAARFVASLDYDTRLYKQDIAGSRAHAAMLHAQNLLTDEDLSEINRGLSEIESEIDEQGDNWSGWNVELEDVHMCVEAALVAKTGDAGRKLHTGRSRNDQVALDLKLWIADAYHSIDKKYTNLIEAFISLAEKDGEVVMPSYTHLQRAQPIVAGGELMAWTAAIDRAQQRLAALVHSYPENPLGSGAIAGSSLPLNRDMTAEVLGVGPASMNSIDGTASRDAGIDFVYALSMTAMTLSRWAEQWIIYASTEFSFIKLDDLYTTGSSMMPQKQNPDMLELVRGKVSGVYGQLIALLTMTKGITIGYNRDLQEDKRFIFTAYDAVCDCLDMATNIVKTTRFKGEHIAAKLNEGFLDATSLAEYLVNRGVPFRTSHQIVGSLVRKCQADNLTELSDLTIEQMANASKEFNVTFDKDVYDWLTPQNVVKRYQSSGNSGLPGFKAQLAHWKNVLANNDN